MKKLKRWLAVGLVVIMMPLSGAQAQQFDFDDGIYSSEIEGLGEGHYHEDGTWHSEEEEETEGLEVSCGLEEGEQVCEFEETVAENKTDNFLGDLIGAESVLAAEHVHTDACYAGHRHVMWTGSTYTHTHDSTCYYYVSEKDLIFDCGSCGTHNVFPTQYFYLGTSTGFNPVLNQYCNGCGFQWAYNSTVNGAARAKDIYSWSCGAEIYSDIDESAVNVGRTQAYTYPSTLPVGVTDSGVYTSGCYSIAVARQISGTDYDTPAKELIEYGSHSIKYYSGLPATFQFNYDYKVSGRSEHGVAVYNTILADDGSVKFENNYNPGNYLDFYTLCSLWNKTAFRSAFGFTETVSNESYTISLTGYVRTVEIPSNLSINFWTLTCGQTEDLTPDCNTVVTSLTPYIPNQTIWQYDPSNTQANATYLDGHSAIISCSTNLNSTIPGTHYPTLSYYGLIDNAKTTGTKTTTQTVVVKPKTFTVSYNANGGTGSLASSTVTYGVNYQLPAPTFTRAGYFLDSGWNTNSAGTGTNYAATPSNSVFYEDTTLYAKWLPMYFYVPKAYLNSYDINWNSTHLATAHAYGSKLNPTLLTEGGNEYYRFDSYPGMQIKFITENETVAAGTSYIKLYKTGSALTSLGYSYTNATGSPNSQSGSLVTFNSASKTIFSIGEVSRPVSLVATATPATMIRNGAQPTYNVTVKYNNGTSTTVAVGNYTITGYTKPVGIKNLTVSHTANISLFSGNTLSFPMSTALQIEVKYATKVCSVNVNHGSYNLQDDDYNTDLGCPICNEIGGLLEGVETETAANDLIYGETVGLQSDILGLLNKSRNTYLARLITGTNEIKGTYDTDVTARFSTYNNLNTELNSAWAVYTSKLNRLRSRLDNTVVAAQQTIAELNVAINRLKVNNTNTKALKPVAQVTHDRGLAWYDLVKATTPTTLSVSPKNKALYTLEDLSAEFITVTENNTGSLLSLGSAGYTTETIKDFNGFVPEIDEFSDSTSVALQYQLTSTFNDKIAGQQYVDNTLVAINAIGEVITKTYRQNLMLLDRIEYCSNGHVYDKSIHTTCPVCDLELSGLETYSDVISINVGGDIRPSLGLKAVFSSNREELITDTDKYAVGAFDNTKKGTYDVTIGYTHYNDLSGWDTSWAGLLGANESLAKPLESYTKVKHVTVIVTTSLIRCPNNHYYDEAIYDVCPYCDELIDKYYTSSGNYYTVYAGDTLQDTTPEIIIKAKYLSGREEIFRGWTSNYVTGKLGEQSVTLKAVGNQIPITVKTIPKEFTCSVCGTLYYSDAKGVNNGCPVCKEIVKSINVVGGSTTVEKGDTPKFVVEITYNDNHTEEIESGYLLVGYDKEILGYQDIQVTYGGKEKEIRVNVVEPAKGPTDSLITDPTSLISPGGSVVSSDNYYNAIDNGLDGKYTDEILNNLFTNGKYKFNKDDYLTVTIKVSGKTYTAGTIVK